MEEVYSKTRIMIIDDTAENLYLLNKLLSERGYDISLFPKAELAYEALEINTPDLILLDINMPGMNGFEFCEKLNNDDRFKEIPVIFLSAMQNLKDKLTAFRTGGVDYITKPFQFDEVLIRVQTHLKLRQQQRQLEENYRHLQELEKSLERSLDSLERDEEAGRMVQFKLLPQDGVAIDGMRFNYSLRPSLYMSGDFVDYFDVNEQYAIFYIADASGHGAASAFITFLLKSYVNSCREHFLAGHDKVLITPSKILGKFNQMLYEEELDKYVTMFYGAVDKTAKLLTYSNGGHFPFPFLFNNDEVVQLNTRSAPVGMFDFTQYKDLTLELPEKFRLTVFSDGILEILQEQDTEQQIEELKKMLNTSKLNLNNFIDKLTDNGETSLLDDITALSIEKGL